MSPERLYVAVVGAGLLLQGVSTLAFRLSPALDHAFPQLLGTTQMMPAHSLLHIATGALAAAVLILGRSRAARLFAGGFGAFYLALAAYGWVAGSPPALMLQPFDHPFHALIGVIGLLVLGVAGLRAGRRSVRL